MESITFTPNYDGVFRQMLAEAQRRATPAANMFADLADAQRARALRDLQRWFAPLTVATQCATRVPQIEDVRNLMADILTAIDTLAASLEADLDADEDITSANEDEQEDK